MESAPRKLSGQYYWGQQWTVRPNIGAQLPTPVQQSGDRSGLTGALSRPNAGPGEPTAEIPIQSRPEWVEEWQARQGASAVLAAQRVEDPGAAHQSPATTDPVVGQNKGITAWRRPFAMFLPAARFYGAIVLVCIALLVVLHLVTSKSSSSPEPSAAAFLPKKSTTDSIESSLEPKDLASKESSSEAAVVIDGRGAPLNQAAQEKPALADSALGPAEFTAAAIRPQLASQPAVSDSSNAPAEMPATDRNNRPLEWPNTTPSGGIDAAPSNDVGASSRRLAIGTPEARSEIVLKGAPTIAPAEARGQPTRRYGSIVSPEQALRIPVNPPPAATIVSTKPGPEAGAALTKAESRTAEANVTSGSPADTPSRPTDARAEPVPEITGRDVPSTTVQIATLVSRGDALFERGDVVSARLFYERAADAGDAQAAIRLGETFDPTFILQAQLKGVRSDAAAALKWYKRAQELGASDADVLVKSLQQQLTIRLKSGVQ